MPTYTGTQFARAALKEIGVLDPIEDGAPELIAEALEVGTDLLDSLRNEHLTISGVTRTVYALASGQQTRTIGSGGNFDQDYPADIRRWSVIADNTATHPVEQHRGRPLTDEEWQAISVKTSTGVPSKMWFDQRYAAGLARLLFWPIPNIAIASVVLYQFVPAIVSLVAATSYDLQPGFALVIKTGIANELAESGRFDVDADRATRIARRHARALGRLKKANIRTPESRIRSDFATIGYSRRVHNLYTDS